MTKPSRNRPRSVRTLSLKIPVRTAAQAIYDAAEGVDGVLFSHASEEFVGFRLGRFAREWVWIDSVLRPEGDGTWVRVVSRFDSLDYPTDPSAKEHAEIGLALVVGVLEQAKRRHDQGPDSG